MQVQPGVGASIPFHLARAYGVSRAPAGGGNVSGPTGVSGGSEAAGPSRAREAASRLVGATVPGGVSFEPAARGGRGGGEGADGVDAALPFYRHPSERNEAATIARVGRGLDVEA